MKKLLILLLALLTCSVIVAQGGKEKINTKSFIALHGGPSFPIGEFGKKNLDPLSGIGEGGFAKTGINLNLNYGYQFVENFGLAVSLAYNKNKLDNDAFLKAIESFFEGETDFDFSLMKLDHWQWYGLTAGPAFMYNFSSGLAVDIRLMGGIANVNSPKLSASAVNGTLILMDEDWAVAPVFQGGANLRINVGKNLFIITGLDYVYLYPKFTIKYPDPETAAVITETAKQKISVLNLTGGLGLRF